MKVLRKLLKVGVGLLGLLVVAAAGLVGYAQWRARQPYNAPFPKIVADTSPEALARGERIFEATCAGCHRAPDSERAVGQLLKDVLQFGNFYSANLTSDPIAGIGALPDAQLARMMRYGVTRDNRRSVMGGELSDEDIAAVMGYLRSDRPAFTPDSRVQQRSEPSWVGNLILVYALGEPKATESIHTPSPQNTLAYGRYLATARYDCGTCHTAGFNPEKTHPGAAGAFAGGFELQGAMGEAIWTRNLTFHETGLAGWSESDFGNAVRTGASPRGEVLRWPMLKFRSMTDEEVHAIYAFLQSLPPTQSGAPKANWPKPLEKRSQLVAHARAPEEIFNTLGCKACHQPGASFHGQFLAAADRDEAQLAAWIRHPESFKPGTQMPTYAALVSEEEASALARWVRSRPFASGSPGASTATR